MDPTIGAEPDGTWSTTREPEYWRHTPARRHRADSSIRRPRCSRPPISRRAWIEVALPGADRPTLDGRTRHRRLEPGLPLGEASLRVDPAVRPDADAWDRHLVVAQQARNDHAYGHRARPGRRLPLHAQPGHRAMGPADLPAALRRDERTLESLLRVHGKRTGERRVALDGVVPKGVRARLPARTRWAGPRDQRAAQAARASARADRPRPEPVPDAASDLEPTGRSEPKPTGQQPAGLLPWRPIRRRRGERHLRHRLPAAVGCERKALPRAPVEAVRIPRMGPLGNRRRRLHPRDGEVRADASPGRAPVVVQRSDLRRHVRHWDEAAEPSRIPCGHLPARALASFIADSGRRAS